MREYREFTRVVREPQRHEVRAEDRLPPQARPGRGDQPRDRSRSRRTRRCSTPPATASTSRRARSSTRRRRSRRPTSAGPRHRREHADAAGARAAAASAEAGGKQVAMATPRVRRPHGRSLLGEILVARLRGRARCDRARARASSARRAACSARCSSRLKLIDEDQLALALALQFDMPYLRDLPRADDIPVELIDKLPINFARQRLRAAARPRRNGRVMVAIADPHAVDVIDAVAVLLGEPVEPVVASSAQDHRSHQQDVLAAARRRRARGGRQEGRRRGRASSSPKSSSTCSTPTTRRRSSAGSTR